MPTMDFEAYAPTNAPAEEQRKVLAAILENEDAAGIEYVVVMPQPTYKPDNRALYELCRDQPRVLPMVQVNPNFGQDALDEVETAATQWGMKGVKLMPTIYNLSPLTPQMQAVVAKSRELGMYVNVHSGIGNSHPLAIGAMCRRFPEVKFIMDHMGYRHWLREAIVAAQDNPNLYLGTTIAAFEPGCVENAVKEVGPERVIFGSNFPAAYADLAVEAIRRQKLGKEVEELIFGGNLARILGMA